MISGMWLFAFMIQMGMAVINFVLYSENDSPISLGAGVFCGTLALSSLIMAIVNVNNV